MSQVKDLYKLYKCEICGNQISGITKIQQSKPSSLLWTRYGLCSPGCLAPEAKLRKGDIIQKQEVGTDSGNINLTQVSRFENQFNDVSAKVSDVDIMVNKKNIWHRVIACGKITGGIAFATGLFFYYTEFVMGALICLAFGILSIVLCRIGVWKKCRVR